MLPPLNTAGESQDCTAVAENYLWWEICEGNEYRGVQGRERVGGTLQRDMEKKLGGGEK